MISGSELRKGIIIELDGKLLQVIDYQHVKMKRTALAKVKLRDINAGHTMERSFQSNERLVRARIDSHTQRYLYNEGELYYFMDEESFEQTPLTASQLSDDLKYLKEGISVNISSYKGKFVSIELPITIELEVTKTDPGFKGDTATGGTKLATLETGLTVQVPLFVNEGDILKIDTRTASYLERSS